MSALKSHLYTFLRATEKYTKTDMVYLASNTFWTQASTWFVSLASFVLYVVFANTLSKDVYGTYQYLLSVGTIVGAFSLTGMGTSITRAIARGFEGTYRESIRIQLLWGLIPFATAWSAGAYYLIQGNQTLGYGLFLLGIFIPLNTTFNTYGAILGGKKDFRHGFLYGLFVNIPYYLAMVSVVFSLPTALALLAANLISQGIGLYIAHRKTLLLYPPNNERDPDAMRYGFHLSLMNFLSSSITKLDDLLVFHFLGAVPLALYSIATAIPDRLGIFKQLGNIAFPKYAQKSREEILSSLPQKTMVGIGVGVVIATFYALIAPTFFHIFFPRYVSVIPYSQVYAFFIVASFGAIFVTALRAHGRTRRLYIYNLLTPLLLIVCEVIGILSWGLWGLIFGKIIATFLSSGLSVLLLVL